MRTAIFVATTFLALGFGVSASAEDVPHVSDVFTCGSGESLTHVYRARVKHDLKFVNTNLVAKYCAAGAERFVLKGLPGEPAFSKRADMTAFVVGVYDAFTPPEPKKVSRADAKKQ